MLEVAEEALREYQADVELPDHLFDLSRAHVARFGGANETT